MTKTKNDFDSVKTLLELSKDPRDSWTVDDAMKGISIMGGTGSGKTSASGKVLAMKYLTEGWGGLVLCAKNDEADLWRDYCEEAGRGDDFMRFQQGSIYGENVEHRGKDYSGKKMVFNRVDYEFKREGEGAGETQNITNIFMNVYRMGNRIASEGDTREERYWDTALKRCLNRVIELLKLAGEDLSYLNMVKIINATDGINMDFYLNRIVAIDRGIYNPFEKDIENYCTKCLLQAYHKHFTDEQASNDAEILNAFEQVDEYFTGAMKAMGSRTKSIVTESFMGLAEPFLSGLLSRHFSGATTVFPEWTFTKQKIIVLDFPIKEFLEAGITAQCVFKLLFQQAVERRKTDQYPVPVFLWCDEAQYFVNPYDQIFLTTARSSRVSTVYLSQNISNYFAVMGSGGNATARVNSLMGNLSTKIFHANSDAATNEYASRLIGNDIGYLPNVGTSQQYVNFSFGESDGISSQYMPQVQAREFTVLKSGGELNKFKVQAIISVIGREWSDGKNFTRTTFTQKFKNIL